VRPYSSNQEESGCDVLIAKADEFLDAFEWAKRTGRIWVGKCIPGVLGLFLLELDSPGPHVDKYVWIVVSDLPPAYLSSVYAKSPRSALDGYIGEMEAWIQAVKKGQPTNDLIPVNAPPTLQNAEALASRLAFLEREILPELAGREPEVDRTDKVES
jgi:hypothetical protein